MTSFYKVSIMRTSLFSLFIALAAILPISTASAAYYYDRHEDSQVTRYGGPDWYSNTFYDSYIYASPYRTQTHALHPYYRNSYNEYSNRHMYPRNSRPEFHRYLEDLYYDGAFNRGLQYTTAPSVRCYNYTVTRTSQWSPRRVERCN